MGEDFRTDTFATGSHRDGGRAARYMAFEREKAELRRERDELVLRIAGDLGPRRLAASLGVTEQVCERMLAAARERQGEGQFAPGVRRSAQITVRRLRESRAQELGDGPIGPASAAAILARRGRPAGRISTPTTRDSVARGAAERAEECRLGRRTRPASDRRCP